MISENYVKTFMNLQFIQIYTLGKILFFLEVISTYD